MKPDEDKPEYDAADPEAVSERKAASGRRRKNDDIIIAQIMEARSGRDWVWRFLERCHIFAPSFNPNSPEVTAYREGERNVGLSLLQDVLRAAPDQWVVMTREHADG